MLSAKYFACAYQYNHSCLILNCLFIQVEILLMNAKLADAEESPAKIVNIQQIIVAINALSKVLSCSLPIEILLVEQNLPCNNILSLCLH